MEIIKLTPSGATQTVLNRIGRVLATGGVVAYPTDTVYGLGAIISCQKAVEKIRYIKNRAPHHPLSIMVRDLPMAHRYGYLTPEIGKYLPGPYTVLVIKKTLVKNWISHNDLVGIRLPDFWFTKQLMHNVIEPIVTTSANLSGYPPVYSINDLLKQLSGRTHLIDLVVDAGILPRRAPSTIVDLNKKLVRRNDH
ncbi:MAG: L-threonylcarbamoyladenylate synthase [Patescibacteria group bacterium]